MIIDYYIKLVPKKSKCSRKLCAIPKGLVEYYDDVRKIDMNTEYIFTTWLGMNWIIPRSKKLSKFEYEIDKIFSVYNKYIFLQHNDIC